MSLLGQVIVWGYADAHGAVVARWTYDAWGNVLSEEVAARAAELRAVRYRFQGRERSAATGLVSFRMRWYDPVTGRWLSKDPIGLSGGLNLYAGFYCDPVNFMDAYGEFATVAESAVVVAIGAAVVTAATLAASRLALALSRRGGCRGERGWAARPDGTPNPGKKFKPTPDGGWEYKDRDGKKHKKPGGFDPNRGR